MTISLDELSKQEDALKVLKENHVAMKNFILSSDDRDKFAEGHSSRGLVQSPTPS